MTTEVSPRVRLERAVEQLERRWSAAGSAPGDAMAPGLSEQQVDDLAGEFGVTLNEELRAWWGWRDGAVGYETWPNYDRLWNLLSRAVMPPLRSALEFQAEQARWNADEIRKGSNFLEMWTMDRLVVVRRDPSDLAAIITPGLQQSPILELEPTDENFETPRAQSLAEVLELWARAIDEGWVMAAGPGRWTLYSLPHEVDVSGLII